MIRADHSCETVRKEKIWRKVMKKEEIKKGKSCTDGKGNVREVLDCGPQFRSYSSQNDNDTLKYKLIAKKRGPDRLGDIKNCTRASFASWAKQVYTA